MDRVVPVEFQANRDSDEDNAMSGLNYAFMCEAEPNITERADTADDTAKDGLKEENAKNQGGEVSSSDGNICEIQVHEVQLAVDSSEVEDKLLMNHVLDPIDQCDPLSGDQANEEVPLVCVSEISGISAPESQISTSNGEVEFPVPEYSGTLEGDQTFPKPVDLIAPNFEGPCKFGIIFPGMENTRTPSVYVSELMNKVFLRMGCTIIVKFTFDPTHAPSTDLFVRATLKFVDMDVIQYSVDRCKVHVLEDDPLNKSHEFEQLCKCTYYNMAGHVLRSPTQGAIYCYDPLSRRHSVMSPLKGRSHDVIYSLHCKSSCPKGIDRRPMQIVFTLELLNGIVLGQTSLNVKVCTSPKRDRDRGDAELKNSAVKRRRVYYERIEPPKNVMLTAHSNGDGINPSVSMVDLNTERPFASIARKTKEKIGIMKQQLAVANNAINRVLHALNDIK